MFCKVLVANRGEIAIRAFRAAYELGARTVAVFPYEDRNSDAPAEGRRVLPDRRARPPGARLPRRRRRSSRGRAAAGADAVYPGYGFLSENPDLAEACADAGHHLRRPARRRCCTLTGNKARAIAAAREAGVPVLRVRRARRPTSTRWSRPPTTSAFPLFVKAVAGGGGRGMRRVDEPERAARGRSRPRMREAEARVRRPDGVPRAGRASTRATSRCRSSPTPPATSSTCSSATARCSGATRRSSRSRRRRTSTRELRDADLRRRRARSPAQIGYVNAGTVEFLLDERRQLRLHRDEPAHPGRAHGHRGGHRRRPGAAPSCGSPPARRSPTWACARTTIDAARRRAAVPDHHRGPGQRLPPRHRHDHRPTARRAARASASTAAPTYTGAEVSAALRLDAGQAHLPRPRLPDGRRAGPAARSPSSASAASPPTSRSCRRCSTTPTSAPAASRPSFIDERPQLLTAAVAGRPRHQAAAPTSPTSRSTSRTAPRPVVVDPVDKLPDDRPRRAPPPDGSRQLLLAARARGVRRARCARRRRSPSPTPPSATRTSRCSPPGCAPATCSRVAPHVARTDAAAAVAWRLGRRDLRRGAALPRRGPVGAAGRAARGGAEHLPADAAARPQHRRLHAVPDRGDRRVRRTRPPRTGIDIFRIFDALNDVEQMRPGDRGGARDRHGRRRGRALLHRRPVRPGREALHPRLLPAPGRADRRRRRARARDQGHGRAAARRRRRATLVTALRERFDLPVHLHTHDTAGRPARHAARGDRRRASTPSTAPRASMAGTTSQPSLSALVAATDHTERDTGLSTCRRSCDLEPYWEARAPGLRAVRVRPAVARPAASTPTRSPAASCPTCASRRSRWASATGSSRSRTCTPPPTGSSASWSRSPRRRRWSATSRCTWSASGADPADFEADPGKFDIPDSVIGFLRGELGDPPGGWPEPFRTKALAGPHRQAARRRADRRGRREALRDRPPRRTLNRLLFPGPTKEFDDAPRDLRRHRRCSRTIDFLYGLRAAASEHAVDLERGQAAAARAGGDRRAPTSAACAP